jgi:hypothetical protein
VPVPPTKRPASAGFFGGRCDTDFRLIERGGACNISRVAINGEFDAVQTNNTSQLDRKEALRGARRRRQFEDVQTYERAHGQDVKRKSKAEAKKKR